MCYIIVPPFSVLLFHGSLRFGEEHIPFLAAEKHIAVAVYVCSTIQCIICSSVGLLSYTHSMNSPISHLSELTAKIIPCAISIDTPIFFNNSATAF